jgi:catechol 2,3-dioxygenase
VLSRQFIFALCYLHVLFSPEIENEEQSMSQVTEKRAGISPTFHHFGVLTSRMEEMIDWYGKVLGMTVNFQSAMSGAAFASNDRAHHRMALITLPSLTEESSDKQPHAKLQHVAFEHATIDDLLNTWERLRSLSIEPVLATDHGMSIAFYYRDPDGNSVELFVDTFGDWEKSAEYIRTSPEFHQNPMGAYIDPAKMMEARKAGASFADLHRRAYAGEFPPSHLIDLRVIL